MLLNKLRWFIIVFVFSLVLAGCGISDTSSADEQPLERGPGPAGQPPQGQPPQGQDRPAQPPGQEALPPVDQEEQAGQRSVEQPAQQRPAAQPAAEQPTQASDPPPTAGGNAADSQAAASAGSSDWAFDTGQRQCYSDHQVIDCPQSGQPFFGQDAHYQAAPLAYQDNGDGTVTDLNTGLMWQKTPDLANKSTYAEAVAGAATFNLAGYNDWRLPTIQELYSLIDFNGHAFRTAAESTPFINTAYFDFAYGDESAGERMIDAQYWTASEYVGLTMNGDATVFGVNFADGRIKGYPRDRSGQFVRYVRGNSVYGGNDFVANGDGTVSDLSTGLMWQQADSGTTYDWAGALSYCQNLSQGSYDDWRLPNAKELHSIVDYSRAPDAVDPARQGAAIDPIFGLTSDDSFFWTSTTHLDGPNYWGVYIAFGQAWGYMELPPNSGNHTLLNVHGAGAQRSDPKSGDPAAWPTGNGPQGDIVRINNYARCVRGGGV